MSGRLTRCVTALYAAGAAPSRLRRPGPSGDDRLTRPGAARQRNARLDERALADFCEAARVRSAFVRRVAHSIRPEGAAAAGAQLRAHAAATAVRLRECVIVQLGSS